MTNARALDVNDRPIEVGDRVELVADRGQAGLVLDILLRDIRDIRTPERVALVVVQMDSGAEWRGASHRLDGSR